MSLNPQVLRSEQHVEVGQVIQRDAGILIERWARRAVQEQPDAARTHHQALLDHLPRFLQTLGQSLIDSLRPEETPHDAPAREHGEQRWEVGWSLPEVVRDYHILRLVLIEYLEETLERSLHFREIVAINLALDEAIAASIAAYVRQRDEYVQRIEKERAEQHRQLEAFLREQADYFKEADQRKNEFLAILAHELRNPLAPILTSLELFRLTGTSDPSANQARDIIERQVRYMVRLVDDLLDLTRIAQGKLSLKKTIFDVRQAVNQAVQTTRPLLEAQAHQLSVELPAEPIHLEADEARIVQVLVNLLSNAGKYTERGGRIRLTAVREGGEAVLRVGDNGIGIEADMLGRIFDPFTQVGSSLHRAQGGLGIGLTLVRRLVEMHGGKVSVHSDGPGKGSEFKVCLPIAPVPAAPSAPTAAPAATSKTYHILIVEDNTDARETLATLLRMLGHRTETAATGPEGVRLALDVRPQVVLIDLGLPGLDGFQVARQIRAVQGDSVRLIALTGHVLEEDRRRTEEAGFDAHLPKPVELEELNRMLAGVKSAP